MLKVRNSVGATLRSLLSVVFVVTLTYGALLGFLSLNQKNLLFHPRSGGTRTPLNYDVAYEDVFFHAEDGKRLHGWWVPHPTSSITLLYCHGNAAHLPQLSHVTSIFHSYGWNAFLFDYRAYGKSEGTMEDLSETALAMDADAALRWVRAHRPQDSLVVWGHSLGASVAAALAHRTRVEAVILEGAFTSILDMARHQYPFLFIPEVLVTLKFSTREYVQSRHGAPLLMIHPQQDSIVPYSQGRAVFDAAPPPKEWLSVPEIDHNDFPSVNELYREKIVKWVAGATSRTP